MNRIGAVSTICFLGMLVGCANVSSMGDTAGAGAPERPDSDVINWDNPIGGQRVDSRSGASDLVDFPVVVPNAFGQPAAIYVVPASDGDRGAIDLMYNLSVGRVVVAEFPWDFPPKHWDEFVASIVEVSQRAAENPSPSVGPEGEEEIVFGSAASYLLPDGRQALVTTSEDGRQSDIRWLSASGNQVLIQGPDLSRQAVADLADQLAKEI
jgi:hypothetical protein